MQCANGFMQQARDLLSGRVIYWLKPLSSSTRLRTTWTPVQAFLWSFAIFKLLEKGLISAALSSQNWKLSQQSYILMLLLVQYSGSIKNEVYVNFTRNLIHNVIFVTYPHPLAQSNRLVEVWYTYSKQGSAISTLTIHGYSLVLKLCLNYVPKIFRCSDITTSRHGTVSTDLSDSKWRVRGLHDPA